MAINGSDLPRKFRVLSRRPLASKTNHVLFGLLLLGVKQIGITGQRLSKHHLSNENKTEIPLF